MSVRTRASRLHHADEIIDSRGVDIFRITLAADRDSARRKLSVPVVPSWALIVGSRIEMRRAATLWGQYYEAGRAGGKAEVVLECQDVGRGDRIGGHERRMQPYEQRQPIRRRGARGFVQTCIAGECRRSHTTVLVSVPPKHIGTGSLRRVCGISPNGVHPIAAVAEPGDAASIAITTAAKSELMSRKPSRRAECRTDESLSFVTPSPPKARGFR